eukprot:107733-Prorocentrum_minimum.AAC.2
MMYCVSSNGWAPRIDATAGAPLPSLALIFWPEPPPLLLLPPSSLACSQPQQSRSLSHPRCLRGPTTFPYACPRPRPPDPPATTRPARARRRATYRRRRPERRLLDARLGLALGGGRLARREGLLLGTGPLPAAADGLPLAEGAQLLLDLARKERHRGRREQGPRRAWQVFRVTRPINLDGHPRVGGVNRRSLGVGRGGVARRGSGLGSGGSPIRSASGLPLGVAFGAFRRRGVVVARRCRLLLLRGGASAGAPGGVSFRRRLFPCPFPWCARRRRLHGGLPSRLRTPVYLLRRRCRLPLRRRRRRRVLLLLLLRLLLRFSRPLRHSARPCSARRPRSRGGALLAGGSSGRGALRSRPRRRRSLRADLLVVLPSALAAALPADHEPEVRREVAPVALAGLGKVVAPARPLLGGDAEERHGHGDPGREGAYRPPLGGAHLRDQHQGDVREDVEVDGTPVVGGVLRVLHQPEELAQERERRAALALLRGPGGESLKTNCKTENAFDRNPRNIVSTTCEPEQRSLIRLRKAARACGRIGERFEFSSDRRA